MKVKVKEGERKTYTIRLEMFDSILVNVFRILASQQHTLVHKKDTNTHTVRDG